MSIIATHSGGFHADDVFAVAALKLHLQHTEETAAEVVRTRNPEQIESCDYAIDVGGVYDPAAGRFDHHQAEGAGQRENGIPYAAFGLIWKEFGVELCEDEKIAEMIDKRLVQAIDAPDNGVSLTGEGEFEDAYPYYLASAVSVFNRTWKEPAEREDEAFAEMVEWATALLHREIEVAAHRLEGEKLVEEAYEQAADKRVIYMDQDLPWQGVLAKKEEPLFVVYPKDSGRWRLRAVPAEGNFESRAELPEAWRGKHDAELQQVTGVDTAIFCHKSLPMIVAEDKAGIDRLVELSLA
ncbi:MAG: MYG1 family protein [Candidatus Paceibacterota bacterium]